MSYACVRRFHYILLEITFEQGLVTILDSRGEDPKEYADMTAMLQKYVQSIIITPYRQILFICWYQVIISFAWQGLEKIHLKNSGTAEEAAI